MVEQTRRSLFIRGTSTLPASYWRGSRSDAGIPEDALLTENGAPIFTEYHQYIVTET